MGFLISVCLAHSFLTAKLL